MCLTKNAILILYFCYWSNLYSQVTTTQASFQNQIKNRAFEVLEIKCNSCHATKKRTDMFTRSTMDSLAEDIHKQVFVKQKMPKGRKIVLTEIERQDLISWLDLVLKKE